MRALIDASTLAASLLTPGVAAAGPAREAAELAQARKRWSAQHALDYTFRLRCAASAS